MKTSARIAVGGIFSALAVICLCLAVIPSTEMVMPALAGFLMIPIALELGKKWAWVMYAAVSVLALIMAPIWEAKLLFILFFGYYPILKARIEAIRKSVAEWLIKLVLFNVAMVLTYWLLLQFFHLDPEAFVIFGINMPLFVLAFGNAAFYLYDCAMTVLLTSYMNKLHPYFSRMFRK